MANEITIAEALNSLCDNPQFVIRDTEIEWHSIDITQPTDAEIDAEVIRLQAVYDAKAYQRTRAVAYEEVKEQLDQLYHDMTAGKLDATGEWHKAIKAVKDATPKP